ncbi:MAG: valine--tRNA ligase, partial [Dehalococcoidia bacterium]
MVSQSAPLSKAYDPSSVEERIYALWEEGGYFQPQPSAGGGRPFTIIMPPPNVTGVLHLGHALTKAIQDCLVRWHRMLGDETLWLPGLDHAGIATQNVVEAELAREGLSRHDLGREQFVERTWQWVQRYRPRIELQLRKMGASCDWSRTVFTLDRGPQLAVRTTFKRLYDDGKIYRGPRIINWCPRCRTALSDLEVDHQEEPGRLWYVRYPYLDDAGRELSEGIVVATTRPETIPADVAVAVNPNDERWRGAVGRRVKLPLAGIDRALPVIADEGVEIDFGTGALKITPGHDPLDFEVGKRHNLEAIRVIDWDGRMTEDSGPYAGLERAEAGRRAALDLEAAGYLVKSEEHPHRVGHCQRCGTVVEPLVSNQWFVEMEDLAAKAAEVVRQGQMRIVPERFAKVYLQWMDAIRPWCISRQLWWGHRIPAWYCLRCDGDAILITLKPEPGAEAPAGSVTELLAAGFDYHQIVERADAVSMTEGAAAIVSVEEPETDACPVCAEGPLLQDPDVLDTWFSSGLWPHSTLGWPQQTEDLGRFYPGAVMETGYDILFFWVARMVMLGCYNMDGEPPFETVYLHGMVRDAEGRKMSKSLGNIIDPLDAAEQYGMDALRFALATGSTPGNDMRLTDERLEGSRNFANKLWNGARFVLGELGDRTVEPPEPGSALNLEDRWILSRLQRLATTVDELMAQFQLGEAGRQINDFLWSEFFDWYVEASKVRLRDGDESP